MAVATPATYEAVLKAYHEIQNSTGQPPSIRAIQEAIKGGSLETIHRHVKRINQEQPEISINVDDLLKPVLDAAASSTREAFARGKAVGETGLTSSPD